MFTNNCWLLKSILDSVNKEFRQSLWDKSDRSRDMSLITREKVCRPRKEGGFGVQHMEEVLRASLFKYLAKCFDSSNPLRKMVKLMYKVPTTIWHLKQSRTTLHI